MALTNSELLRGLRDHLLRKDFAAFVHKAFVQLNPGQVYEENWHIRAICDALMGIFEGDFRRLIINLPPRHLKSHIVSVCFPAFLLMHRPQTRIMCVSYGGDLSDTFHQQTLDVMQSDWYRSIAPDAAIDPKRTKGSQIWTRRLGYRMSASVGGALTGKGADVIIIDDPLKAEAAYSDAERNRVNEWFGRTLATRVQNPKTTATILVAQRLHMDDLTGHLLANGGDWRHLKLAGTARADELISIAPGVLHRRRIGELLHPTRFGTTELKQWKSDLGSMAYSAQVDQEPQAPAGNLIKLNWFGRFKRPMLRNQFEDFFQSWDTAVETGATNDWSVCTTWAVKGHQSYLIDVFRERLGFDDLLKAVYAQRKKKGARVVFVETSHTGKAVYQSISRRSFDTREEPWIYTLDPIGKVVTVMDALPAIERGEVILPDTADYLPAFEQEVAAFPGGKHDDQVDSMAIFLRALRYGRGHVALRKLSRYK